MSKPGDFGQHSYLDMRFYVSGVNVRSDTVTNLKGEVMIISLRMYAPSAALVFVGGLAHPIEDSACNPTNQATCLDLCNYNVTPQVLVGLISIRRLNPQR